MKHTHIWAGCGVLTLTSHVGVKSCIPKTDKQPQRTTIQRKWVSCTHMIRATIMAEGKVCYLQSQAFHSIPGLGDELLHPLLRGRPRLHCCGIGHHFHWDGHGTWFYKKRNDFSAVCIKYKCEFVLFKLLVLWWSNPIYHRIRTE